MAIYELRTYQLFPNNREWLHDRFRRYTTEIFKRLGFDAIGFWSVSVGDDAGDLVYLMRWDSYEERDAGWTSFERDPEWQRIRKRTNTDHGPLVARTSVKILQATDYSALQ